MRILSPVVDDRMMRVIAGYLKDVELSLTVDGSSASTAGVTGSEKRHSPDPKVVVEPAVILMNTQTRDPTCMYRPVRVPVPMDGLDTVAVQDGLYDVHVSWMTSLAWTMSPAEGIDPPQIA
jgi:hypothetical protein